MTDAMGPVSIAVVVQIALPTAMSEQPRRLRFASHKAR
jgi:hypothetical protein